MIEKVPQLTEDQKLIVEALKARQEKELKTKCLEIDALKILKVKKDNKLDQLQKYNSKIIADHGKITIPDRWSKLVQDQDIQTHPGYFKAGLKAILLEKISELKAMRETKAGIEHELEKGNAALTKAHEKTNELNDLLHFATNHNQTEPVDVKKPRAMVPTLRYDKLMKCDNLTKEICQLEIELQTLAESKQGLIATFADSNVLEMNTFLAELKRKMSVQTQKEQENIDKLLAEWDPNTD